MLQVEAYLGLVPREWSSSEVQRRGHITKAGNSRLRWLVVEAAWRLATHHKRPQTQALREWAERIARRRGQRVAMVALAHDPLWNAAQRELVVTGTIHNYLRMLWGKKVVEWSRGPAEAYRTLVHLNNKYALDGRNPNSYAGILWCVGLFDRPWAHERRVLGVVRYMSSEATARKFRVVPYLDYVHSLGNETRVA